MRRIAWLLAALTLCGCERQQHATSLDGLERMNKMNVLYVSIAEPMILSSKSGRTSQKWLVCGGAFYQVDLGALKKGEETDDSVEIVLDEPAIVPAVNMKKTRLFSSKVSVGYTDAAFKAMFGKYMNEARKLVNKAAQKKEYMDMAKEQTLVVLKQMVGKEVRLRWKRPGDDTKTSPTPTQPDEA